MLKRKQTRTTFFNTDGYNRLKDADQLCVEGINELNFEYRVKRNYTDLTTGLWHAQGHLLMHFAFMVLTTVVQFCLNKDMEADHKTQK